MLLNEIMEEVGMTKRAIKYYEEKGLLSVAKDQNGYRNYTKEDVETLKKISVYRKLGISIKDIQHLLKTDDKSILLRIYQEKMQEKALQDAELEALKQFIEYGNADQANELLDYQSIENAIECLLPGKEWSDYLIGHFKPFLNVKIKTPEQKQALKNILEYCDQTTLKVPFMMRIGVKLAGGINQDTKSAEQMIAHYRDMSESEYEKLKEQVLKGAKLKSGIMKYHPAFIAQRKMLKEFQNKGYNDIFLPNLMVLSPPYAEYKKALDQMNDRICRELGLHYDSNYNLVLNKKD
ncbi:MAG: MerR family transcriptional regulator [Erysipelotrichaceae bacterium]|nr:MerR family transcriptional regulator [Erysipelotrichaceae bacterium]